jgi:hypothetical protein
MKIAKLLGTCLCLCFTLILAPTSRATVTPTPQIVIVGSSGAWYSMAVSSVEPDSITAAAAPCTGATSPTTTPTTFWSQKNTAVSPAPPNVGAMDSRPATPVEGGNVWVSWNADAAATPYGPSPIVCAYLSVDSVVGQRMLFGTASGTTGSLVLGAAEPAAGPAPVGGVACAGPGLAGAKAVPQFDDHLNFLPCPVWNILVSHPLFNGAATDIRPEDALFANSRALAPCGTPAVPIPCGPDTTKNGLGYGPYPTGVAVNSSWDSSSAKVIAYNITGNDPISTADTVTPGATLQIGAYPVMLFANTTVTTNTGDFGTTVPTNILSHIAGQVFAASTTPGGLGQALVAGGAFRTSDVTGSLTIPGQPMNIVIREPVSGTFNTMEWQLVRDQGYYRSQEWGVDPADNIGTDAAHCTARPVVADCGNPYFQILLGGATRRRAIGTGQLVNIVGGKSSTSPACTPSAPFGTGLSNGIGYAFWSFATYADSCVHADLKYLQLDGVDPLWSSYAANPHGGGVFPVCTTPGLTCDMVPFTNMVNGSYRAWNIIRMVMKNTYTNPAFGPSVPALVLAAQDQAHTTIPDFVPFVYCTSSTSGCAPAKVDLAQTFWIDAPTGVTVGLTAFRSHLADPCTPVTVAITICPQTGTTLTNFALNGTNQAPFFGLPPWTENEGDMYGAVFTVTSDVDSLTDFSGQQGGIVQ